MSCTTRARRPAIRRAPLALLIAITASLLIAGGGQAWAKTHVLVLGKTSTTRAATGLTSANRKHPALSLRSKGGKPAAGFKVAKGVAPFTVSSTARIPRLDADLLDGLSGSQLQRSVTGRCASGTAIRVVNADGTVVCQSTTVNVPPAWKLTGNAGTDPSKDFLGTTDAAPLVFATNAQEAMRIAQDGRVGMGTSDPISRLDVRSTGSTAAVNATATAGDALDATANNIGVNASGSLAVLGRSDSRAIVGVLGPGSCPGAYAVGGCGATTGNGVVGTSVSSRGVAGSSTNGQGVLGTSTNSTGVDAESSNGIGLFAKSSSRGIVSVLTGAPCPGTFAIGGCGAGVGDGVQGSSTANGVVGISSHPFGGSTAAAVLANNTSNGDVFIGEHAGTHVARIDSAGVGYFDGGTQDSGADYAEAIRAVDRSALAPGDVLSIARGHGYAVSASRGAYSSRVIGVYSTKPAVLAVGSHRFDGPLGGRVPVAMMGVVPTKVTTSGGPIRVGNLLTTSAKPGRAMRAKPVRIRGVAIYPTGAIIGKALEPLRHGSGTIRVLLMSR